MTGFALETPHFAGPLEALLDLIEARKMPVSEVSLSQIADGYLSYIQTLPELPMGETAQFILIASTLLLIKSRTLLPSVSLSDDETRSIEELERRLKQYALIRKAAKSLKKQWGTKPFAFALRGPKRPAVFAPAEASPESIYSGLKRLVAALPKPEKLAEATVAPVLALEEVITNLKNRLERAVRTRWSELKSSASHQDLIVYFLAILELVRSGSAQVSQEDRFGDIVMEGKDTGLPRYGT